MTRSDVAGALLVASFVLWLPAALLPRRIWTAPLAERLDLVAARPGTWQAVNLSIGGGAVFLVLGVAALAQPLAEAGGGVLVPLAVAGLVLGAGLALGAAIVHAGRPAGWSGWSAIVLAGLILVQLLATGDALPALYHVAPALIGVALLLD